MPEETTEISLTEANESTRPRVWEKAFLIVLADMANVTAACKAVNISRPVVYEHKNTDERFAALWEEACEIASDSLVAEATRRGRDGYDRPVFQGGEEVGVVREYSDTLLITLLKARRPSEFRENIQHDHKGEIGVNLNDLRTARKEAEAKEEELKKNPNLSGVVR